jgi:peptidoglycan/xylan/chitin deacetylase (PgdA/CDA1 family)
MALLSEAEVGPAPTASRRQILATLLYRTRMIACLSRLRSACIRDLRILAYHRVLSIDNEDEFAFDLELISASEAQFREQMALLKRRFNPVRFSEVIAAFEHGRPLPPQPVIVTFDDGYDDNYHVAFPILRELGVPAMFFVSTGHIDSGLAYSYDWFVHMICRTRADRLNIEPLKFDEVLPASRPQRRAVATALLDRLKWLAADVQEGIIKRLEHEWSMPRAKGHADCRPMRWEQLREMQSAGMEVGSHGMWHNMLAKLPLDAMRTEVVGSREALMRELGVPTDVISYPVGGLDAYDDHVIRIATEAGYKLGCSYISGTSPVPRQAQFELRRLPVERHMNMAWFASLIGIPEAFSYPSRHRLG